MPDSPEALKDRLQAQGYLADTALATVSWLGLRLGRPLLLEGEAGVGKTALAKALADTLGRRLIRLQCHDGIDLAQAAYEWNVARQMLRIRMAGTDSPLAESDLYTDDLLLERPLLAALRSTVPVVLLIDELDRADEAFEAFLLEFLSDWQISIPEKGTMRARHRPLVLLTSNRTRELHDALKRRCLYQWLDYPDLDRELAIVRAHAPHAAETLSAQVVHAVQTLRQMSLFKPPGIAETLDWIDALIALDRHALDASALQDTLGVVLKVQEDLARMQGEGAEQLLRALP
ncbi:MAG: AAA family ATPase [Burkholderiaceae bacterium]